MRQSLRGKLVGPATRRWLGIFFASALLSTACYAQNNNCLWLNEATASDVLGGRVTLEVQQTPDGGGSCIFRTHEGTALRTLEIDVRIVKDGHGNMLAAESQCTSPAIPIRGVGNEAVSCGADSHSLWGHQVISYVRDQAFVLRITTTDPHDLYLTPDLLQHNANDFAEQVAGSLF